MIHRVLVGGTASGKKLLAAELFRRHGLRPLSMDSMKVYRGMDIGTDKPSSALRAETDFGLLDLAGHHESFSAGRWIEAARHAVDASPGPVLFAGGTPLYLRLLLRGLFPGPPADPDVRGALQRRYADEGEDVLRRELRAVDPVLEARLLPGDEKRILRGLEVHAVSGRALSAWQAEETTRPLAGGFLVAALRPPADTHAAHIAARVERMFAAGLLDEVAALAARAPFAPEPGRAIGYLEARECLAGRIDRAAAAERTVTRTRRLVRKQRTFLASFPEIRWVDVPPDGDVLRALPPVQAALGL